MGLLEIPYGTRDFLPAETATKRKIEGEILNLFAKFGYEEIITPTMEFLETLTISGGRTIEPHLFRMFDVKNRTLALRHEMTTPIARLAVNRLKNEPLPLKLSYNTNVFRFRRNEAGRQCEFYQAGVELLGISNAFADAEVISLAAQALRVSGLKNFKICLGQVDFAGGMMKNLPMDVQTEIKTAIERHDIVKLNELDISDALKVIPTLQGGLEVLETAEKLADNEQSWLALKNLREIYRLLEIYGVSDKITFDLGLIRDFEYYTGMVFEAYGSGVGYSLAGGGRYDNMLKDFGYECPATGFALGIERILVARKFEGFVEEKQAKDYYMSYAAGKENLAIKRAEELRLAGKKVEISLTAQDKMTAERFCAEKNCSELIYIE